MEKRIAKKYRLLEPVLDERTRRIWAAAEARSLGRGGIARVCEATGLSRGTVRRGLQELDLPGGAADPDHAAPEGRARRPGGGRKRLTDKNPELAEALQRQLEPVTRGDPESALLWTCKSAALLAEQLRAAGHAASERSVNRLLHALGFSLQSNRKTLEGGQRSDRDRQFQRISERVREFQQRGDPVVSVGTKRKELDKYRSGGQERGAKGAPEALRGQDSPDAELSKATSEGVCNIAANERWASTCIDGATAAYAAATVRSWWRQMGGPLYAQAGSLLITSASGGSNSSRSRLWKRELQQLADDLGLRVAVSHFPPGTSKWNKIEHRMVSRITEIRRGRPMVSREVVVELIATATDRSGLTIRSESDTDRFETGLKVTDEEMESLCIEREDFDGDWNYTILPRA